MKDFFTKKLFIVLFLGCLFGGVGNMALSSALKEPASGVTKTVMIELLIEALQDEKVQVVSLKLIHDEMKPLKEDVAKIHGDIGILADNVAEEWVRVMHKQYLKVQTNRDDLSWEDVEYALSKWPVLPYTWKTPELEAKIEYLEKKYDIYISNGSI